LRSRDAASPKLAITGHTLRDVKSILEKHYLKRDPQLAVNAISKLERGTKIPEWACQPIWSSN
jgi:hypothetical protein